MTLISSDGMSFSHFPRAPPWINQLGSFFGHTWMVLFKKGGDVISDFWLIPLARVMYLSHGSIL